jgi:putative chitinase
MNYQVQLSSGGQTGTDQITSVFDFYINKIVPILQTTNQEMTKSKLFLENAVSNRFYNNSLPWFFPNPSEDKYSMILFEGQDATNILSKNSAPTDTEYQGLSANEKDDPNTIPKIGHKEPLGVISVDAYYNSDKDVLGRVEILQDYIDSSAVVSYSRMKTNPQDGVAFYDSGQYNVIDPEYKYDNSYFLLNYKYDQDPAITTKISPFNVVPDSENATENKLPAKDIAYTIFTHNDSSNTAWGLFLDSIPGRNQRIAIHTMCQAIMDQMTTLEERKSDVIGDVLAKANEEQNSIYKQFHIIYHQWNLLAYQELDSYSPNGTNNICGVQYTDEDLGIKLENEFTQSHGNANYSNNQTDGQQPPNSAFIYDYPLNPIKGDGYEVDVKNSIINIDALYKPDANTTVLNIIQQICQKNNFMFIPFPGNGNNTIREIYSPNPTSANISIRNYFYVMFLPTAESRVYGNNNTTPKGLMEKETNPESFQVDAIGIDFGSIDNQIIKNLSVNLDDNKPTAESIVNLQRLVSNENNNKTVTKDSSTLPVIQGRSYTASLDMLGNAQIYPMQYFYIRKSPIFGGLYQIMKVEHAISPNDMTTKVEGIRLAFAPGVGYGGIPPVTLGSLSKFNVLSELNLPSGAVSGPDRSNITQSISTNSLLSNTDGFNPYGNGVTLDINKLRGSIPDSVFNQLDFVIRRYGINTVVTMSHFLAQASHESGNFSMVSENLNYTSSSRLKTVFPSYFPGNTADNYVGNPQKIGNHVYANRNGNGNEASGDGYKFRGRGYLQLTGKANYIAFGKDALVDLVANPNLVATKYPLISAGWFFKVNNIIGIAAQGAGTDTIMAVTLKVNGGTNGLQDRIAQFNKFYKILNS